MNINIRHRIVRWTTVAASTLAVGSTLAVAVPQANALTIVVAPKYATCKTASGGQVPEGTELSKVITMKAPDGTTITKTVTVTCGKDGNWH